MMEGWRDVPGYEGLYRVSTCGRVWSARVNAYLKPESHYKGHLKVVLYSRKSVRKKFFIHRLVAIAFMPGFKKREVVNHINGTKDDNRVENLEWTSIADNTIHYYDSVRTMEERNAAF